MVDVKYRARAVERMMERKISTTEAEILNLNCLLIPHTMK
jgi:hypothetical protein